jgi:hypothetical protein
MSPPLLRRPWCRFGLVLSLTLIGGSAGFTYGVKAPPSYTARAYVVTTGRPAYAQAYGRVATSGPVLAEAATLLGTDTSGLDQVTASTPHDAPVIELTASSRSPARAALLANAVAGALAAYGSDREATLHAGLAVLAPATVPTHPSSPDPPCELIIGASAGLLAGAVAALFTLRRRTSRPTFDDPAEIEGHLRIWRAQYGPRTVTAYRGAASLTEPPDWTAPTGPASPGRPPLPHAGTQAIPPGRSRPQPVSAAHPEAQPTSATQPEPEPPAAAHQPEPQPAAAAQPEPQPNSVEPPESQPTSAAQHEAQPNSVEPPEPQPTSATYPEPQPNSVEPPESQPTSAAQHEAQPNSVESPEPQPTSAMQPEPRPIFVERPEVRPTSLKPAEVQPAQPHPAEPQPNRTPPTEPRSTMRTARSADPIDRNAASRHRPD